MKPQQKITIPDQLKIIINTSIPGYQQISYKPNMTIKNTQETDVLFNPLIKLNKKIIDTVPEEYRIKEFFNSGLFKSLENYMDGDVAKAKDLVQATRRGFIDNNIDATLDTIFLPKSIIHIGEKPYVIIDVQWTTGDWSINVKNRKEEININKIKDPQKKSDPIKNDIDSGEEQLKQLPIYTLTGANYNGPPIIQNPTPSKQSTTKTHSTPTTNTSQIPISQVFVSSNPTTTGKINVPISSTLTTNTNTSQTPISQVPVSSTPTTNTSQMPVQVPVSSTPTTNTSQTPVQVPVSSTPTNTNTSKPIEIPISSNPTNTNTSKPIEIPISSTPTTNTSQTPISSYGGAAKSSIAYTISIDMEVRPGTTLTDNELKNIKCNAKYNAVKKAYAIFSGKPYKIAPLY